MGDLAACPAPGRTADVQVITMRLRYTVFAIIIATAALGAQQRPRFSLPEVAADRNPHAAVLRAECEGRNGNGEPMASRIR